MTVRLIERIDEVPAAAWDACAGGENPFLSHAFLSALEASRSAVPEAGWAPRHLIAEDARGAIVAAAPMYLKSHSYGEYVFDHSWADAYRRAGGRYYPKLLIAVPFTPVPGPRILIRPGAGSAGTRRALIDALAQIAERLGVSSLHANFCTEEESRAFAEAG